ncbi:MAG: cytochrome c [candidate division Zixibacteria bacterium]|nr:cytochrome c [candidate division Zixibacteria bacterium]MBU1470314.1 cytochrome c [candidate division Zixibacteria bacterium]MBU2624777.1 cytochrome c [candidate division Zixibacteria bacterium]
MKRNRCIRLAVVVVMAALITVASGCFRDRPSEKPPIHLVPDMDSQPKYKAQEENKFFEDGSAMRQPIPGTVARGDLREDAGYYTGIDESGDTVKISPVLTDMQLLKRGQERFDIYCSPCHGRTGDGQGIMLSRGYVPPPTFHSDRLRDIPDGYVFDVVTNGIRNMPSYRQQIPVRDRWAIIAYLRALQRSQNATIEDVPQEQRTNLK